MMAFRVLSLLLLRFPFLRAGALSALAVVSIGCAKKKEAALVIETAPVVATKPKPSKTQAKKSSKSKKRKKK